jgi:Zn-finger nucleic acid-binding protein
VSSVAAAACVKCSGNLIPFQPKPGVNIAMCRKCKGLWFPRGMLARHLQAGEAAIAGDAGDPRARGTRFKCNTCPGTQLVEHPFGGDARLLVDSCPSCGGMFLDPNEL